MVAFTGPNEKCEVACLPSCADAEHPPLFEPVKAGDYILAKLTASMELHSRHLKRTAGRNCLPDRVTP